jgi:hypothetical protein
MGVSGQHHVPAMLYLQGKEPGTHWTGGWVGLRVCLDIGYSKDPFFASAVDRTPVIQSVVKHYTNWATPATVLGLLFL